MGQVIQFPEPILDLKPEEEIYDRDRSGDVLAVDGGDAGCWHHCGCHRGVDPVPKDGIGAWVMGALMAWAVFG